MNSKLEPSVAALVSSAAGATTRELSLALLLWSVAAIATHLAHAGEVATNSASVIRLIDSPESGFFAKRLDFDGIAIKASMYVVDEALFAARNRLSLE